MAFNEGLVGVTADSTLLEGGSVEVNSRGYVVTLDGETSDIVGDVTIWDNPN